MQGETPTPPPQAEHVHRTEETKQKNPPKSEGGRERKRVMPRPPVDSGVGKKRRGVGDGRKICGVKEVMTVSKILGQTNTPLLAPTIVLWVRRKTTITSKETEETRHAHPSCYPWATTPPPQRKRGPTT